MSWETNYDVLEILYMAIHFPRVLDLERFKNTWRKDNGIVMGKGIGGAEYYKLIKQV